MHKGCWKVDDEEKDIIAKPDQKRNFEKRWKQLFPGQNTSSEAVYIDVEEEADENAIYSKWDELPDLLLEEIFSYLSIREKYYASLVCRSWYRAFYLPYSWSDFVMCDSTLTRGRFNYYSGWQYVLDHLRTQMCITRVARNFRKLTFEPMLNFYNLYEFMNMLSWYTEQTQSTELGVGSKIRALKFTFPCNMADTEETEMTKLFGTGGKLLGALKRLMANLKKLRRLELIDLMLDPKEAQYLLDEVCEICCLTLRTLILINTTRVQYQLLHVGVFLNLQVLMISPQNLGDDLIDLLGFTQLTHLHILQNRYTPNELIINPVSGKCWMNCRKNNPKLCVHLELESVKEKQIVWQDFAPVKSILYDSPKIWIENDAIMTAVELYRKDLQIYGHKSLPKCSKSKPFHERADGSLLLLCRECFKLKTLIITEMISTATVLLIAFTAKHLQHLHIRGNSVIKRCDWPQSPEWSGEFYKWLQENSKSYEFVEKEVSQLLGYKWHMLSDKEFKLLNINVHRECV